MSEHVAERCPKCGETERHYWCRCRTLIKGTVCPMCDRTREEAMERGHAGDPIPLACGTEITPDGRVILEGEVCLRRQLAQAQAEVERLRREREVLAEALKAVQVDDEENVDNVTHFALYHPDLNVWECQAKDCGLLWEFEDGNPYEDGMRFCPRCGRRIEGGGADDQN